MVHAIFTVHTRKIFLIFRDQTGKRPPVSTQQSYQDTNTLAILPEDVPVTVPDLPLKLVVNTPDQFKALGDPLRRRILAIIQYQPDDRQDASAQGIARALNWSGVLT